AKRVNLEPLRQNNGLGIDHPVSFNIIGERIYIDKKITLDGQFSGNSKSNGNGVGEFFGSLFVDGKPLISEAKLNFKYGPDGDGFSGEGLIGEGKAKIDYQEVLEGESLLVITTSDGGKVLSGLDLTEAIRGGEMRLVNKFLSSGFSSYDTQIDLKNFRVVEAPAALQLFSVLSPIGLYAIVEGEGTKFRFGTANLQTRGDKVNIMHIKGHSDAVDVSVVGTYQRSNGMVNLSGTLVPARLISSALGQIPLVGQLITGADNSGLFVTQFKMKGPVGKPNIRVNPVTSIAPGLIRDILSPNWIKKEQKRFFGKNLEVVPPSLKSSN
ncbi:MAG: hypothetical protein EBY38_10225, partial [Flavobacteriaceae bacterium]|nr:hypothetical protein [Flavobacteriaceae bacterium]